MVKSEGSGFRLPGFQDLLKVKCWTGHLTRLSFSILIYKMSVIIVPSSSVSVRLKREKAPLAHTGCQAHDGHHLNYYLRYCYCYFWHLLISTTSKKPSARNRMYANGHWARPDKEKEFHLLRESWYFLYDDKLNDWYGFYFWSYPMPLFQLPMTVTLGTPFSIFG